MTTQTPRNLFCFICLTFCLLLSLAGCGGDSETGSSGSAAGGGSAIEALESQGVRFSRDFSGNVMTARFGTHPATAADFDVLKTLSSLREVHADAPDADDDTVGILAKIDAMEVIELSDTAVTGTCLADLSQLKSLYFLALPGSASLDEKQLSPLEDHPALMHLDLSGTNVSDASVDLICSLGKLKELRLIGTKISDAGVAKIAAQLPGLEQLAIGSDQITDSVAAALPSLQEITRLEIVNSGITDATVKVIAALPRLRVLKLSGCKSVNDEAVGLLGVSATLAELDISGTPFTGAGFNGFGFPELVTLEANGTAVTDQQIADFAGVPKLYSLWIKNTSVTEAAIRAVFPTNHQTAINFGPQ